MSNSFIHAREASELSSSTNLSEHENSVNGTYAYCNSAVQYSLQTLSVGPSPYTSFRLLRACRLELLAPASTYTCSGLRLLTASRATSWRVAFPSATPRLARSFRTSACEGPRPAIGRVREGRNLADHRGPPAFSWPSSLSLALVDSSE